MTDPLRTPGSPEAVAQGCKFPVIDNHYGRGVLRGDGARDFWHNSACPLHGDKSDAS